jgi:hypothetical protein
MHHPAPWPVATVATGHGPDSGHDVATPAGALISKGP